MLLDYSRRSPDLLTQIRNVCEVPGGKGLSRVDGDQGYRQQPSDDLRVQDDLTCDEVPEGITLATS